jgi:hypothetical protein
MAVSILRKWAYLVSAAGYYSLVDRCGSVVLDYSARAKIEGDDVQQPGSDW